MFLWNFFSFIIFSIKINTFNFFRQTLILNCYLAFEMKWNFLWFKNKLFNFISKKSRFAIIGCYLSCDEKAFDELVLVDSIIAEEIKLGNFKIIILGDFNADIGRGNTRDKRVRAWTDGHGLICLNMLYTQKIRHTFLNLQGHFSAIDQIFIYGIGSWKEIDRCNVVTSLTRECV